MPGDTAMQTSATLCPPSLPTSPVVCAGTQGQLQQLRPAFFLGGNAQLTGSRGFPDSNTSPTPPASSPCSSLQLLSP